MKGQRESGAAQGAGAARFICGGLREYAGLRVRIGFVDIYGVRGWRRGPTFASSVPSTTGKVRDAPAYGGIRPATCTDLECGKINGLGAKNSSLEEPQLTPEQYAYGRRRSTEMRPVTLMDQVPRVADGGR